MATLPEYDLLRQKATQRARIAGQEQTDAIRRRFAAMGNLNSGAAIKTEAQIADQATRMGEESAQAVGVAEAQELQRRKEIGDQQGIQKEQFNKQYGLQERGFGLQEKQYQTGLDQYKEQFAFQKQTKMKELAMAERELKLNEDVAKFNKEMAKWEQGQPTDIFGQLLGPNFSLNKKNIKSGFGLF